MRIAPPPQISTNPQVDSDAQGWAALLVDGLGKIRISELMFGQANITWPGGFDFSNSIQIAHGLSRQAASVGAILTQVNGLGSSGLNHFPVVSASVGATARQFQVQACTVDAQFPLNTAITAIWWLAVL